MCYASVSRRSTGLYPFQEADAVLDMERRAFYSASMDYVLMLQKVQEKKKFEFVETLLRFMYAWLTFYHQVRCSV